MSAHLTQEQLGRLEQGGLDPAELLAIDDHLAACASCREQAARVTGAALPAGTAIGLDWGEVEPLHLGQEQITAYVARELDAVDREIADAHLELCDACRRETEAVRAFQALVSTYPAQTHEPAAHPNPWQRLLGALTLPAVRIGVPSAALGAALVAVLVPRLGGDLDALRRQNAELRQEASAAGELRRREAAARADRERLAAEHSRLLAENRALTAKVAAKPPKPAVPIPPASVQVAEGTPLPAQAPAEIRSLLGTQGRLMGGGDERGVPFPLVSPVGQAVLSQQPALRWGRLEGARSYVVTVANASGAVVTQSDPLTTTEWTPPRSLRRGASYTWQVTARVGEEEVASPVPPAPEARFLVLGVEPAKRLRSVARTHLALGREYARAGLLDAAERELRAAAEADPTSQPVQAELKKLLAWRKR